MLFLINKITLILIIVISVTLVLALVFILFKMTHKERKVKIDDNFMTTIRAIQLKMLVLSLNL